MTDDTDAFGNLPEAPAYPAATPPPPPPPAPLPLPPAGWYPDPGGGPGQRWWDGRHWHGASSAAGGSGAGAAAGKTDGFAIAAIVLAALGGILLAVIFAVVSLRRIKTGKRQGGRGMAIAALWISGAYVLLIAGVVVLALTGVLDPKNVDKYTGQEREVARVIDRFEDEADSSGTATCALMTEEMQAGLSGTTSSCADFVNDQDGFQANLDATSITITGPNEATALVDEADHTLRMNFVREGGVWKISEILDEP